MKKSILALAVYLSASQAFAQDQCISVADCAQKAMEAALQAKLALQLAVPKGAVMPFNLAECPEGWVPFAPLDGRVVVGAGAGSGLTVRSQGQAGGTETQTLSVAQMPSHSHTFNGTNFTRGGWGGTGNRDVAVGGSGAVSDLAPRGRMTATGGGAAHNIMQPFFVLTYCERK